MMMTAPPVTPLEARLDSASRGDIGARRRFPGDRAANRIHDRGRQHGGGGGFRGRGFEMDAELGHVGGGIGEHIHEMRNRRSLIAADIADAGLQQRLGDRQNALAAEFLAVAKFQVLDVAGK